MFRAYRKLMKDSTQQGEAASFAVQTDALFRKSLTFQKRNFKSNCGILLFPVLIFIAIGGINKYTVDKQEKIRAGLPKCICNCINTKVTGSCKVVCKAEKPGYDQYVCPITSPVISHPMLQLPSPEQYAVRTDSIVFPGLPYNTCRTTHSCPVTVLLTGANRSLAKDIGQNFFPSEVSPNLTEDLAGNFEPSNISPNLTENLSTLVLGSDSKYSNQEDGMEYQSPSVSYIIQSQCPLLNSTEQGMSMKCVRGIYLWRRSSTLINEELFKGYKDGNEFVAAYDFLNTDEHKFNVSIWYNSTYSTADPMAATGIPGSLNLVLNAYLKFLKGPGVKAEIRTQQMPGFDVRTDRNEDAENMYIFILMMVILNIFPVMLTSLVYEKQQKLRIIMKMHGLGDASYWFVTYAYFFTVSLTYMSCFMVGGLISRMPFFTKNDYSIQILFYFIFMNLQIATAFLLSTILSNVKKASILAYVCVLGSGLSGFFFRICIENKSFPRHGIFLMELSPFFSLYRGLYDLMDSSLQEVGMRWKDMNDGLNGMKEVLIVMSVESCIFLLVAYYFDQVVSAGSGVKRHPLFFLQVFQKKSLQRQNMERQASEVSIEMKKPDISQERKKVEQLLLNPNTSYSIICDNLEKIYPGLDGNPDKYAVRGFSLALPRGECFGMLGPNGAGKTSSISMMIGLTAPTSGTAFIRDLDIRTDMNRIYTSMGVCPQHDLLWETLTGREHLLFYGRLKNLTGSSLTQAVEESLRSFNLLNGGVGDKQTRKYSGGMKRRLSVAISLIGDPKVVYLDEPSTGLDPASRDLLWKVVKRAKKNRAIILTTHSMEEAEVLCDRLGIFVDGRFQCIGNPKELKARYGGCYILTITTSSAQEEEVENLVNQLSHKANKTYHLSGTQKFEIPKDDIRIADVFQAVENAKKKFPIQAWGISDTTLEDVFIKVAKGAQGT
ncbi:hypothetical protein AQUCO_01300794v1 [Aquilegia coerulea]|uniref:ABC transporter domain-containing protein n=1 Tax=Aquilegia coerulea TaxID=218851 RepID=A0A2G5E3D3_AQUCA|nr:hypothetical protein AQUCO_01300794v1 [Aquilegia coerulea]